MDFICAARYFFRPLDLFFLSRKFAGDNASCTADLSILGALPKADAAHAVENASPRSRATLRSICQRKNDLLVLGQAALEDAYEYMESRPCVLQILDESGCLLWQCGHVKTRTALAALGFDIGSYWAEGHIGTNAPALAMRDGNPVQVHGDEHFKQALRAWHCSATPVYDNSGRQRAVIVIACLIADYAVSDLPLTLAIAREIGNSLHTDALLSETNRHLNELYALLDGVEDGVLAWDHNGCLQYLNHRAAGMLLLDEQNSLGRPLPSLLTLPSLLQHAIQQRLPLNHVEMTFESRKQFIATLLTLKPVPDGEHCGFIALLHPLDQLRRLVNHQLGKVSQTFEQMPAGSLDMRRLLRYGRQAARGQHPILLQGKKASARSYWLRQSITPANGLTAHTSRLTAKLWLKASSLKNCSAVTRPKPTPACRASLS